MSFLLAITLTLISSYDLISSPFSKHSPPKEYKTSTGKIIIISETHPAGISLSTIEITSKGFEHNIQEILANIDPVTNISIADLDGNGFDEIYIITTSVGSGSYGNVLGFASNNDKSLTMISFPEVDINDPYFQGYMGHDLFSIEDNKMTRTFPIYMKNDTNQKPTGGIRKLTYSLIPGEAMWQLKIEKTDN